MNQMKNFKYIKRVISFGIIYLVIGILSAFVTNPMESTGMQTALRLLALAFAIAAFVYHIRLNLFHSNQSVLKAAINAAIATAFGTFLLAVLANINSILTEAENKNQMPLALIIWPVVTGLLAFLSGFVVAKIFSFIRSRRK
jgi:uncharacterized membrane protein